MTARGSRPTRAERSAARRRSHHQDRVNRAAGSPTATFSAGSDYLLAVIRRLEAKDPKKARQVSDDTTEFLLRQANAHDQVTTGGKR